MCKLDKWKKKVSPKEEAAVQKAMEELHQKSREDIVERRVREAGVFRGVDRLQFVEHEQVVNIAEVSSGGGRFGDLLPHAGLEGGVFEAGIDDVDDFQEEAAHDDEADPEFVRDSHYSSGISFCHLGCPFRFSKSQII